VCVVDTKFVCVVVEWANRWCFGGSTPLVAPIKIEEMMELVRVYDLVQFTMAYDICLCVVTLDDRKVTNDDSKITM